ncbi:MAG: TatD family hydrolase [Sphaerochaetaceae bacterium]|nr:TatD family hydrolase [Sphaerochaetaceae bacterium]
MIDFHRHFHPSYDKLPRHENLTIWWATTDPLEYGMYTGDYRSPHGYGILPKAGSEEKIVRSIEERLIEDDLGYIGEIGIDRRFENIERQTEFTYVLLEIAIAHLRPVAFHFNTDIPTVLNICRSAKNKIPMIFHNYTGSVESAKELYASGIFISIGPRLWKKETKLGKRIDELSIPVLLETDYTGDDEKEYLRLLEEHYRWFARRTGASFDSIVEKQHELSSLFQNHPAGG